MRAAAARNVVKPRSGQACANCSMCVRTLHQPDGVDVTSSEGLCSRQACRGGAATAKGRWCKGKSSSPSSQKTWARTQPTGKKKHARAPDIVCVKAIPHTHTRSTESATAQRVRFVMFTMSFEIPCNIISMFYLFRHLKICCSTILIIISTFIYKAMVQHTLHFSRFLPSTV